MSAIIRRLASLTLGLLFISSAMAGYLVFLGSWGIPSLRTPFISVDIRPALLDWVDLLTVIGIAAAGIVTGLVFVWASIAYKRKPRAIAPSKGRKDEHEVTSSYDSASSAARG